MKDYQKAEIRRLVNKILYPPTKDKESKQQDIISLTKILKELMKEISTFYP